MTVEKSNWGKLIGASLGPGNPEWITRGAYAALENAACWAWPVGRKDGKSYALGIVERAGLTPPEGSLDLFFPMTRDLDELAASWLKAANRTIEILKQGTDVVFLVEGDASFYATFGHLERTVKSLAPEVEIEVIPGVCSPLAGSALEGQALCEGDEIVAIAAATAGREKISKLIDDADAVVLMKVKPRLKMIRELLEEKGLMDRVAFIERAGDPEQRVVRDITTLTKENAHYLSLMIIHCSDGESVLGMNA